MLLKIIIIARHGPREAILKFPKLKDIWNNSDSEKVLGSAKLTDNGRNMCKLFGKCISYYKNILQLNEKNILVISSNVDRTKESAKLFIEGMMESKNIQIYINSSLAGDIRFTNDERIMFTKYINNIKIDKDTNVLNKKIYNYLGIKVTSSNKYFDISSTLDCYESENFIFPPEINREMIDDIKECANIYYYKLFSNRQMMKIFTDDILDTITKIINDDNIKFAYLSTHDVVLFPLACRYNDGKNVNLPGFLSYLKYEVYDNMIKIYYDDSLLKIIF